MSKDKRFKHIPLGLSYADYTDSSTEGLVAT